MKQLKLTNEEVGTFCLALAHLYHAGIGMGDSLALLAEDERDNGLREFLLSLSRQADDGLPLSRILRESGAFPSYVSSLLDVGEQVGKTEETLNALARYYEGRARLEHWIRTTLLYPMVLLAVLLVVIVVLLVWVLPVFNDVYARLGSSLTGLAGVLLALGGALRAIMPALCAVLGAAVLFALAASRSSSLRESFVSRWRRAQGDRGIARQINTARFAQALSMSLSSGMTAREAVELSGRLAEGSDAFGQRCDDCLIRMDRGASLPTALRESELLSSAECRLLEAGLRSGSGETAMEQIAKRRTEESEGALEALVSRIEPTLIAVLSVMVGTILLSVMLPLMHIMTAIG